MTPAQRLYHNQFNRRAWVPDAFISDTGVVFPNPYPLMQAIDAIRTTAVMRKIIRAGSPSSGL